MGAVGGAATAAADPLPKPAPHAGQNRACEVRGAPHFGQNFGTAAPQSGQNLASVLSCRPHDLQVGPNEWTIPYLLESLPRRKAAPHAPGTASWLARGRQQGRLAHTPAGRRQLGFGSPYRAAAERIDD
jgi:hypothetical protein